MSRTLLPVPARTVAVAATLVTVLVAVPEGAHARSAASSSAWAQQNPALGGTSLAVYVAHHHQHALGRIGV
jgi:hypothetical protein